MYTDTWLTGTGSEPGMFGTYVNHCVYMPALDLCTCMLRECVHCVETGGYFTMIVIFILQKMVHHF